MILHQNYSRHAGYDDNQCCGPITTFPDPDTNFLRGTESDSKPNTTFQQVLDPD
jgi:hypothetical protein